MTRAVLSLGSNLGDRLGYLRAAVAGLEPAVVVVSGVYESAPWGDDPDQGAYLNAAVLVSDPHATARDWLERARTVENASGRVRDPGRRLGPRTLDVDVIAVWDDDDQPVISDAEELTLPHPRAHRRAFVLKPWIDIQPYGQLPGHGWLTDLLNAQELTADVRALTPRSELTLEPPPH